MSADQAVNAAVPNRSDPRWRYSAARLAGLLSEKNAPGRNRHLGRRHRNTYNKTFVRCALPAACSCSWRYRLRPLPSDLAHLSRSTNVRAAAAVWGVAWGSVQIAAWASALV